MALMLLSLRTKICKTIVQEIERYPEEVLIRYWNSIKNCLTPLTEVPIKRQAHGIWNVSVSSFSISHGADLRCRSKDGNKSYFSFQL